VTETVIVTFDEQREVFVDGLVTGATNQRFAVTSGVHTFWLSGAGYTPFFVRDTVSATTPDAPHVVRFFRKLLDGDDAVA